MMKQPNGLRKRPPGAVLAGLREVHDDDERLVSAAAPVFDALYAAPGALE